MRIQIAKKTSRFKIPQCSTRSAFDRNLTARASSRKPKTILTDVSHPPERGREFNQLGNKANNPKGKASARPNPVMPIVSCIAPPLVERDPARSEPNIGPVHEKDTRASVSAIKNMPPRPPVPALESALFAKTPGI